MLTQIKKILVAGATIAFLLLPLALGAQTTIPDPLPLAGGGNFIDYIFALFKFLVSIFALVAFGFLVFNGFKLIIARDNQQALTEAKDGLFNAIYGFVAALLSYTLIAGTATFLGSTGGNELQDPDKIKSPLGTFVLKEIFQDRIILSLLGLTFLTAVIMLVYGGTRLILSSGSEQQVTAGKTIIKWATLGIIVILLAYTILSIFNRVFT